MDIFLHCLTPLSSATTLPPLPAQTLTTASLSTTTFSSLKEIVSIRSRTVLHVFLSTLARPPVYLPHYKSPTELFRYASPHLWNQLPSLFHRPHPVHFLPGSPHHPHVIFSARQHIGCLARYMLSPVRLSVRLSHGWTKKRLTLGL